MRRDATRSLLALFLLLLLGACRGGAPPGAPCEGPSTCASRLCLTRPGGAVCAERCISTAACANGDICGRFDLRGIDPDSGLRGGPETEIVRVCRPPLNQSCDADHPCSVPGEICATEIGLCTQPCGADGDCASRRCLRDVGACAATGACAPLCDDAAECPLGWYCDLTAADALGHGRCERVDADAGAGDASCDAYLPDATDEQ